MAGVELEDFLIHEYVLKERNYLEFVLIVVNIVLEFLGHGEAGKEGFDRVFHYSHGSIDVTNVFVEDLFEVLVEVLLLIKAIEISRMSVISTSENR